MSDGPLFDMGVFCGADSCGRAGLVPGCLTHARSERHHQCAFGGPAYIWFGGRYGKEDLWSLASSPCFLFFSPWHWNQKNTMQFNVFFWDRIVSRIGIRTVFSKNAVSTGPMKLSQWVSRRMFACFNSILHQDPSTACFQAFWLPRHHPRARNSTALKKQPRGLIDIYDDDDCFYYYKK